MTTTLNLDDYTYGVSNNAIELSLDTPPEGQVDSVVKVDWCISRDLTLELQAREVLDPLLLLVIVNGEEEMDRYVVPLGAMKTHLTFRRPGKNTVFAMVVWSRADSPDKVAKLLKAKHPDANLYVTKVIEFVDPAKVNLATRIDHFKRHIEEYEQRLLAERKKLDPGLKAPPDDLEGDELVIWLLDKQIEHLEFERDQLMLEMESNDPIEPYSEERVARLETELSLHRGALDQLERELDEHVEVKKARIAGTIDKGYNIDIVPRSKNTGELDVVVPKSMFAKEPWRLTKYLSTRFEWPTKPRDNCHARERAIGTLFAWGPKAFFKVLGGLIIDLVWWLPIFMFGWLLGRKNMDYGVFLHPFSNGPRGVLFNIDSYSTWEYKKKNLFSPEEDVYRHSLIRLVNPLTVAVFTGIGFVANLLFGSRWAYVILGSIFAMIFSIILEAKFELFSRTIGAGYKRLRSRLRQRRFDGRDRELEYLSCNVTRETRQDRRLPRKRRVAYVFADAKARVCRPFPS